MTTAAVRPVGSVDELFRLDPLDQFRVLIVGGNFPTWLRAEPLGPVRQRVPRRYSGPYRVPVRALPLAAR